MTLQEHAFTNYGRRFITVSASTSLGDALLQIAKNALVPENAVLLIKMVDSNYRFLNFETINTFLSNVGAVGLSLTIDVLPDLQTPDEIIARDTADSTADILNRLAEVSGGVFLVTDGDVPYGVLYNPTHGGLFDGLGMLGLVLPQMRLTKNPYLLPKEADALIKLYSCAHCGYVGIQKYDVQTRGYICAKCGTPVETRNAAKKERYERLP